MNVSIVRELPTETWASFTLRQPCASIFHTPEMFEVFKRARGYKPELWAATINEQIVSLFVPVQISLTNGLSRAVTTRAVAFGSVIYSTDGNYKAALKKLLQTYIQEAPGFPLFTELRNQCDISEVQPILRECGFNFQEHLNYLIDLDPPGEEIRKNFSKSIRKHIHVAQRMKLVVHEVTDRAQIPIVYDLLKQTYRRIRIALPSLDLFEAAFDVLVPKKMLKIFLIEAENRCISTRLVLAYKGTIIDWYTGSDREFARYYPEELAISYILQWAKDNGYRLFDFGGAGLPNEQYGPRIFKEKFGGALVNFGRNSYVHHPAVLKISKMGYEALRRFF